MTGWLPFDTPRTRVRLLRESDLADFQAYRTDPEVGRFQGWEIMADADALAFLGGQAGLTGFVHGAWVQLGIADAATDRLIGDIGLWLSEDGTEAELGFTLAASHQGRGLAREAVSALIALLFETTPAASIRGVTDERNTASISLLERLGFTRTGSEATTFRGEPCVELTYQLARDAWREQQDGVPR